MALLHLVGPLDWEWNLRPSQSTIACLSIYRHLMLYLIYKRTEVSLGFRVCVNAFEHVNMVDVCFCCLSCYVLKVFFPIPWVPDIV